MNPRHGSEKHRHPQQTATDGQRQAERPIGQAGAGKQAGLPIGKFQCRQFEQNGHELRHGFEFTQQVGGITVPSLAATSRTEVTMNSRVKITMSAHTLRRPCAKKAKNAAEVSILSARGSRNLPKLVMRPRERAILPSNISVRAAAPNTSPAVR